MGTSASSSADHHVSDAEADPGENAAAATAADEDPDDHEHHGVVVFSALLLHGDWSCFLEVRLLMDGECASFGRRRSERERGLRDEEA